MFLVACETVLKFPGRAERFSRGADRSARLAQRSSSEDSNAVVVRRVAEWSRSGFVMSIDEITICQKAALVR